MKPKQIVVLVIILMVLAGLVIWKNNRPSSVVGNEEAVRLNVAFDPKSVTEIKIIKSSDEVLLRKEQDVWRVPARWNVKGDQGKITQLFEVLSSLRGEFRSDREELLADYDIGNENALHIILSGGDKPLTELLVGLNRPDQRGIFLRAKGSNAVYFSNDQLLVNIGFYGNIKTEPPKLDFWMDFKLLELDTEQVKAFSMAQMKDGKENVVFKLEQSANTENPSALLWKLKDAPADFVIDENKVKSYLHQFQFERAKEILDPTGSYSFENPDFKITINENGVEKAVLFKKHDEKTGDYAVSVAGQSEIKLITSAIASSFKVDSSSFKQDEAENKEEVKAA